MAENNIGPNAYKPDDVISAMNGKTIEVVHSDAEGRMLLADGLTLATSVNPKPNCVLTFATLTGGMVSAIGNHASGFFCEDSDLYQKVVDASDSSGDRLYYFPMVEDYREGLESDIADIKQCSNEDIPIILWLLCF